MAGRTNNGIVQRSPLRRLWRAALSLGLGALLLTEAGCTRRFYRDRADKEVGQVLADKDKYPAWKVENWHVYPDGRARFADSTNADRPPMPPDDPAAYDLSPNPQRPHKVGVARVGGTGYLALIDAWNVENRAALAAEKGGAPLAVTGSVTRGGAEEQDEPAPKDKTTEATPPAPPALPAAVTNATAEEPHKPGYLLTLEQATELGLVNAREYQDRRENLYLAALPVTAERFGFAAQFFAGEQAFREWAGKQLQSPDRNRWRINSNVGLTKVFPTGALLLLRFANQTVVNLTGTSPNGTVSTSTLGLDVVQPFLRGGGRAVTLEPLTQSERNLLYEIRDYARFRKEFFVALATGQPLSGGSTGVGATLVPLSTALPVALEDAQRVPVSPGAGGRAGPVAIVNLNRGGYLPVVLLKARLDNERQNLEILRIYEENFRNLYRAQLIDQAQLNQVRQQRLGSQENSLQLAADFGANTDLFKLSLGVPTDLPLELDDAPLRPLLKQVEVYEEVYGFKDLKNYETPGVQAAREVREYLVKVGLLPDERGTLTAAALAPETLRRRLRDFLGTSPLVKDTPYPANFRRRWAEWEKVGTVLQVQDRIEQFGQQRRELRARQTKLEGDEKAIPEALTERLKELDFEVELGEFEKRLRLFESQPWKKPGADEKQQQAQQEALFRDVIGAFAAFLRETREELLDRPRRERIKKVQENWPPLPKVCVDGVDLMSADEETALAAAGRYALTNRFDLMNVRAQVVDSWRKIAVAANSLLGTFNVEYHLESSTPAGLARPFAFSGGRTRQQLVLNGELPLVRLLERNQYRATLIAYQRQRRALMAAEDDVLGQVRQEVRQLRALARNYNDIQKGYRQSLDLAYFQVDLAGEFVNQPPSPTGPQLAVGTVGPPTAGRGAGGDPAALTQQFLGAIRSLLGAKNDLYNVWMSYLTNRLALYRDLELMPLDFRGVWIDDSANCACGTPSAGTAGAGDQRLAEPKPAAPEGGAVR